MSKRIIKTDKLQVRAAIEPSSYNQEERTIEVVFATETPVDRYNWEIGRFSEILEISDAAIDFVRLNSGAPVLDTHHRWSLRDIIGVVVKAWVDPKKKEARAILRLSEREDVKPIADDIAAGIIRNVSVGYTVSEYTITDNDKSNPTYKATRWQPGEISFAPVQADPASGSRSEDENIQHSTTIINPLMAKENTTTQERSAETTTAPTSTESTTTTTVDEKSIRQQATAAERQRVADITDVCTRAQMETEFMNNLINEGKTIDQARAAIIDVVAERANKPPHTAAVTGEDEVDQIREAAISGLQFRATPGSVDIKGNVKAREFSNMRMLDLAKERLRAAGVGIGLMSEQEIVKRALATSDLPIILGSAADRELLRYYNAYVPEWKVLARQENVTDFREKTGVKVDGSVTFEEVTEGGEYKSAKILQEEAMKTGVSKYGRKYSITDRAIINDDLSVLSRLPQIIALGAQQFQSTAVWDLIINNRQGPDNVALFHTATHKNLAASGGVIGETTLSTARTAMRRQKSPTGGLLGLSPKYLIVPPELETTAEKILTAILASATGDVNVFSKKFQLIVSDALTDDKAWYLAADPANSTVEGLIYSYLTGAEGLQTESRVNWETDSLEIKAKLFFGCKVWGHKGWYKNPGA